MENAAPATAPITPAPATMPEPPPAAPAPPPPAYPAQPQQMAEGGKVGFFDGITLVDWAILALATVGLCSAIYYYRQKLVTQKTDKSSTQKDIDELKLNVKSAMGTKYRTIS